MSATEEEPLPETIKRSIVEIQQKNDSEITIQNLNDTAMDESNPHFIIEAMKPSPASESATAVSATSMSSMSSYSTASDVSKRKRSVTREKPKETKNHKIVKRATKREKSSLSLSEALKKLAQARLNGIFLPRQIGWDSSQKIADRAGRCQVCGHSTCLENCLECGRKGCPMRTKQIQLCLAKCGNQATRDVRIQKGSTAAFLSPLCITIPEVVESTTQLPSQELDMKITPQIIVECIEILEKFRLYPSTEDVLAFLKSTYDVNPNEAEFAHEVRRKLEAAKFIGLLENPIENVWRLSTFRREASLHKDQISAFWEMYRNSLDPLKPVRKPEITSTITKNRDSQSHNK